MKKLIILFVLLTGCTVVDVFTGTTFEERLPFYREKFREYLKVKQDANFEKLTKEERIELYGKLIEGE